MTSSHAYTHQLVLALFQQSVAVHATQQRRALEQPLGILQGHSARNRCVPDSMEHPQTVTASLGAGWVVSEKSLKMLSLGSVQVLSSQLIDN